MLKHLIKKQELVQFSVRLPKKDLALLKAKAEEYTVGNLSEWIRYAGINHVPPKTELTPKKK